MFRGGKESPSGEVTSFPVHRVKVSMGGAPSVGWRNRGSVHRVDRLRGAVKCTGENCQLLGGAGLVFGVDCFIDAGDDNGRVACDLARSEDSVPVPGTVGQAGFRDERGFGPAQSEIEPDEITSGRNLAVMDSFGGGGESGSSGLGRGKVERF